MLIFEGEDEFLRLVTSLPPSLLNEAPVLLDDLKSNFDETDLPPIYTARLAFLAQLRDFILFRQQGAKDRAADRLVSLLGSDLVPVGFRAVLLYEAVQPLEGEFSLQMIESNLTMM